MGSIRYAMPLVFALAIATMASACAEEVQGNRVMSHDIEIELFLKEHRLKAIDHVCVQCINVKFSCFINKAFQILSVSSLNRKLNFKIRDNISGKGGNIQNGIFGGNVQCLEIEIPLDLRKSDGAILDIAYEGALHEIPSSLEKEDVGKTTGIIDERGVYLSPACMWYPDVSDSLATFRVTIIMPTGYETVTQGILVGKKTVGNKTFTTWEEKNVSEGYHLVAGRYKVTSIKHDGIDIYAFFFPEEQCLVETYLNATTRYLEMYQNLLGDYPYGKFAIVENFFQTGYGMPSFTLLGNAVVKLPFIVETSLGHEILHNWWGNSVFVEDSQGNWCEGLTTYMADYYYKELQDVASAEDYRREVCRKYTNYVTDQNDFPLKKFISRRDQISQAIGYGKTAMVFHMLRRKVGDESFYGALKSFYKDKIWQKAGWKDIQQVFEDTSKKDLSWFFEQWINREGAPFIELGKAEVEKVSDGWLTKVEIFQRGKPYHLFLPIDLELDDENFYTVTELKELSNPISIQTKSQPMHIAIDPRCDMFRRLHIEEIPPTLDLVLGDNDKVFVYPTGGESSSQGAYKRLAESLLDNNKGIVKADTEVTESEMTQKSLFILGGLTENKLTKIFIESLPKNFLLGEGKFTGNNVAYNNKGDALLVTFRSCKNSKKGIALFIGLSSDIIKNIGFKIAHYGKYSYLVFSDGKSVDKGVYAVTDNPLQRALKN
ncbi:MAG TPA: M1 family metallopeptidase [Candidatus Brocadiaceae bacterium]